MNLFSISCIFVAISSGLLGVLLLFKSNNKYLTNIWAFFCIAAVIWSIGAFIVSISENYNNALLGWQIAYIGAICTVIFYIHFVIRYLKLHKPYFVLFTYVLGSFFLFITWYNKSQIFFGNLRLVFNQFYWVDWFSRRSWIWLVYYLIFYWILLGYSFFLIVKTYTKTKGIIRNQLKYFILGSIVGWLGTESLYLPAFRIDIYPAFFNFLIVLYAIIFTYAIVKYRLMDIKLAVTRAGVFIAVYTLVLGLPFAAATIYKNQLVEILGSNWWMFPFIIMAILATSGPFIYIYIDRKAENALLREQKRYQETLKQASVGMTRIRSLRRLLELIAHIVTKTVKISYVGIYIRDKETDEYILQVNRDKGRIPIPKLTSDNPLIQWLIKNPEPLIYEEVKLRMEEEKDGAIYKPLEESMRLLTASVVIPSFLEKKPMGIIVLGDKMSGQIYTYDDLSVFQVLASQAAMAIENAQFYEEAKEMQAQIAQAEKMATIGTMADGLSHQINNRFYALSLIAGDALDTIKFTDSTKCTPETQEMLKEINHALERIEVNVMKGGEVVKGILKYTRKENETFEPLTIDQVIDGTLEMVQYKIRLSDIDIIRDYPKDSAKIKGNLVQLQEVFFNFIDNAYDATVERKAILKEPEYRGRITISAKTKENIIEITVQDNGMGIKEEDTKKVFTPFFTTKVSSRKGTGLGLYVINKLITDNHKGKISFDSAHQVGTRFIIELPKAMDV